MFLKLSLCSSNIFFRLVENDNIQIKEKAERNISKCINKINRKQLVLLFLFTF